MHQQRRLGPGGRGVVTSAPVCAAVLLLLTACSPGTPRVEEHDLSPADRTACQELVADLPATLAGEDAVPVEPAGALGAAWGDPAYVLTCGVPQPEEYAPTAECNVIAGVGWWVPDDQLGDQGEDVTAVALSLSPYVEVDVPAERRTEGVDRALSELAPALRDHLGDGLSCL